MKRKRLTAQSVTDSWPKDWAAVHECMSKVNDIEHPLSNLEPHNLKQLAIAMYEGPPW